MVFNDWSSRVEAKIDRIINDVYFIKNRASHYLGHNEALTYLKDETPIFVNTDDFGCPINFMSGGEYEEEYFRVLLSFREAHSIFLDVGANLGVYSLRLASYLRNGKIYSFEPLPRIRSLFSRSSFLNNCQSLITIHPYALSDKDEEGFISIPTGHAGGANLQDVFGQNSEKVSIRRLDGLMSGDFKCDMIKLDVEGHEMNVLNGMQEIIKRSPKCVVLFEKLGTNSGIESNLYEYAELVGWNIYAIHGMTLSRVTLSEFREHGGYFIAAPLQRVEKDGLFRDFFDIYPVDLNPVRVKISGDVMYASDVDSKEQVAFHGPYWFVPRGTYRVTVDGEFEGQFRIDITEQFGYKVDEAKLSAGSNSFDFVAYRDLHKFEFVCRPLTTRARFSLKKLRVTRLG